MSEYERLTQRDTLILKPHDSKSIGKRRRCHRFCGTAGRGAACAQNNEEQVT